MNSMLAAEDVLKDCELALESLEAETDRRKFRLFWLAAVAALRSVGHVLEKIDSKESERMKKAIAQAYTAWKSNKEHHKIFWQFIEEERNTLLKEGEPAVQPVPYQINVNADFVYECDFDIFAPMLKDPYMGEDCRDVLRDAINWWRVEIDAIKSTINT